MEKTMKIIIAALALGCVWLTAAFGDEPATEWHPDKDKVGVWFDPGTLRVMKMTASEFIEGEYSITRLSLDPAINKMQMYTMLPKGKDFYETQGKVKASAMINGPEFIFTGTTKSGKTVIEKYKAVGQDFVDAKLAEAQVNVDAMKAKKEPTLQEMGQMMVWQMIIGELEGIVFPE